MSEYQNPLEARAETEQQQNKGLAAFLSPDERKDMQRKLQFPEEFPPKFWSALIDKVSLEGLSIPASQIAGANFYRPKIIRGEFTGATWTNYQDVGAPSLTVGAGTFLLQYGWGLISNSSANLGILRMAPSVNDDTPDDADALSSVVLLNNASTASVVAGTAFKSFFKTIVLEENNNLIELKTKVTDGNFSGDRVWLIAIKIGN